MELQIKAKRIRAYANVITTNKTEVSNRKKTKMGKGVETMTDLISRADAIEAVRKLVPCEVEIDCTCLDKAEIMNELMTLPSADKPSGEWKPVSEELPQSVGSYLVTCIGGEYGSVYVDYDYWTVLDEFKYNRDKVTAWMPLPKPYCCSYGERKDNIT